MAVLGLRRGVPKRHEFNVTGGTSAPTIEVGDLLYYNGTTLKPMSAFTWDTSEEVTRRSALPRFAGVADFAWNPTDNKFDKTVQVPHSAIFEMGYTGSQIPKRGTLLGFSKDSGGNYLYDQTLEKVIDVRDAIGYCAKDYSAAPSTVLCVLFSDYDNPHPLSSRTHSMNLWVTAAIVQAGGGTLLTSFTFGKRVKLTRASAVTSVVPATNPVVFTFKNAANAIDDTLSIVVAGAAVGKVTTVTFDDANGYDFFAHNDAFNITTSSDSTGNPTQNLIIDYMDIPLLVDA